MKVLKLLQHKQIYKMILSMAIINFNVFGQSFQNIKVVQSFDTVKVYYDIVGGRASDILKVKLSVSNNGGNDFNIVPKKIWGDIGSKVLTGTGKVIYWEPLSDGLQLIGNNYVFDISGNVIGAPGIIETVPIKGGTFIMGDQLREGNSNEEYLHEVKLDDYSIGEYEITNIQYAAFLQAYGSDKVKSGVYSGEPLIYENKEGLIKQNAGLGFIWTIQEGKEYNPVVGVTWYGAYEFCRYYGYRLPTEAEWEYAARELGKMVRFGNGKNVARIEDINFNGEQKVVNDKQLEGNIKGGTSRIGNYDPNSLVLFDMSGNVWEWCQDWYSSNYYFHSKKVDPIGPWLGIYKVIRGGSYYNSAFGIRTTVRSFFIPYEQNGDIGFRVATSAKVVKKY